MLANKTFQFHDGQFKILILADIQESFNPKEASQKLVRAAVEQSKPDLIVLLGDNIMGKYLGVTEEKTVIAVHYFARRFDEYQIPFALVFGNHDHEGLTALNPHMTEKESKEYLLALYQQHPMCVAVKGEEMTGVGNYNIPLKDSKGEKTVFNLWFMDSNSYTPASEGGGYGYVHEDQLAWYHRTADALKAENGGKSVPSMVFQHIIVPEAYDMLVEVEKGREGAIRGGGIRREKYFLPNPAYIYGGALREGLCPPKKDKHEFRAWKEQGDVVAAFFGHDHENSFAGIYEGIHLIATPAITHFDYGHNQGFRTVTLHEDDLTRVDSDLFFYEDAVGPATDR